MATSLVRRDGWSGKVRLGEVCLRYTSFCTYIKKLEEAGKSKLCSFGAFQIKDSIKKNEKA